MGLQCICHQNEVLAAGIAFNSQTQTVQAPIGDVPLGHILISSLCLEDSLQLSKKDLTVCSSKSVLVVYSVCPMSVFRPVPKDNAHIVIVKHSPHI